MYLAKALAAIDWLSIIYKSDLSDEIKRDCVNTTGRMHHMNADKTYREKARRKLHKNVISYIKQILEATLPTERIAVRPLTSHLKNHPSRTNKICRTLLEKQGLTYQ